MGEIKKQILESGEADGQPFEISLLGMGIEGGEVICSTTKRSDGSGVTNDVTDFDPTSTDTVKVALIQDDDSCIWAYENDDSTYCAVKKLTRMVNTGFLANPSEKYKDNKKVLELLPVMRKQLLKPLRQKVESIVTYQHIFTVAYMKKLYDLQGNLIGCLELDTNECSPIRDLTTGELGGMPGKGLDSTRPNESIALIQAGHYMSYDAQGNETPADQTFYFTRDEMIPFTLNERGKFKGVSPIMRMISAIRFRRTIINLAEVVLRRFGPQIIVTIGNKDVNFSGNKIPTAYTRDSSNQPVDRATAEANYRKAVFNTVKKKIKLWANTDTLVHIQEYGYNVETLNPSSALPDYIRFINTFDNIIKNGVLGLFVEGRVDITSGTMRESASADMKDIAKDLRESILTTFNNEYFPEWLKNNGVPEDSIEVTWDYIDKSSEQTDAIIERTKSEVIRNYGAGGHKVPPEVLKKLNIKKLIAAPKEPTRTMQGTQGEPTAGQKPTK